MECVNCGKRGHSFRDCKEPVMSFGICAVKIVDGVPHYLMIRRRDSLAYVEFLRGKYKLEKCQYIQTLLEGMTKEERGRLLDTPFDKLWENLWYSQITRQFRYEYEWAKRIFESLRNTGDIQGKLLSRYIEIANTNTSWIDAEWGFPKGRRTIHESELSCALREFQEETGIPSKAVTILKDEPCFVEEYIGTNGIPYKQIYFLGVCAWDTVANHQPNNKVMSREVGDVRWTSYEVAFANIRNTNPEKRDVLTRLHSRLQDPVLRMQIQLMLEWKQV